MKRLYFWTKRCAAVVSAGMVFQAAGCQAGANELTAALVTSVLNNLITNFVFGTFNLVA